MKRLLIAVLLAALVSALPAQTIRVVLWFQAPPGLPEAAVMDLSEAIIQGALDKSFESGFIGTNDRPRAGSLEVFQNYLPGEDSLEGFVDYELLIFADFMRQETSYPAPDCVYRLIKVSDLVSKYEATLPAPLGISSIKADVDKACMLMGAEMIQTSLRGR